MGGHIKLTGRRGFLTSETKKLAPETLVRNFVSQHAPAFGLRQDRLDDQVLTDASYQTINNRQNWVRLTQEVGGIPVFGGELTALVTESGQIASLVNGMAPALEEKAVLANTVTLTPEDAAFVAAAEVNIDLGTDELVRVATSENSKPVIFQATSPMRANQSEQVIFPLGPGNAVIGWLVTLTAKDGGHSVIVNATDGSVLFRKNLVAHQTPVATQDATFEYYLGDSPAPCTPYPFGPVPYPSDVPQHATTISIGRTTTNTISGLLPIAVNRMGWVEDFNDISRGNNVYAYRDQLPGDGVDTNPGTGQLSAAYGHGAGPSQYNRNFLYSFLPAPLGFDGPTGNPFQSSPYDNGSVTNMFVWTNLYHDIMYRHGFTEGARNFQEQNFVRGALGNDAVLAEAQDWTGTNNANFLTPPDGVQGVMQMYAFPDIERDSLQDGWQPSALESSRRGRDSALDQQVLIHELTHGLSNRLIGNGLGLVNHQGGGMGEGWSDFYALSILSDIPEDNDPDKVYPVGGWLTYDFTCAMHDNYFYGIRRFPYSTNLMINPLTMTHTSFQSYYPGWFGSGYYASPDRSLYPESPLCRGAYGGIVHNIGEIWCSALWQARSNIMRDFEKAINPTPPATTHAILQRGNEHMLQLVTDGMKLTPPSPTFLDARDAIFEFSKGVTGTSHLRDHHFDVRFR